MGRLIDSRVLCSKLFWCDNRKKVVVSRFDRAKRKTKKQNKNKLDALTDNDLENPYARCVLQVTNYIVSWFARQIRRPFFGQGQGF